MTSAWVRGTSSVQPSVAVRSPVRTLRGSSTSVAGRIGFPWTTPPNIEASSSYEERTAVSRWLYWCTATSFVPSHSTSIRIERATSATTSRSSSVGAPSLVSGYLRVTSAEILSGAAGNAVSVRSCSPASRQSGVRCASTFAPKYEIGHPGRLRHRDAVAPTRHGGHRLDRIAPRLQRDTARLASGRDLDDTAPRPERRVGPQLRLRRHRAARQRQRAPRPHVQAAPQSDVDDLEDLLTGALSRDRHRERARVDPRPPERGGARDAERQRHGPKLTEREQSRSGHAHHIGPGGRRA